MGGGYIVARDFVRLRNNPGNHRAARQLYYGAGAHPGPSESCHPGRSGRASVACFGR